MSRFRVDKQPLKSVRFHSCQNYNLCSSTIFVFEGILYFLFLIVRLKSKIKIMAYVVVGCLFVLLSSGGDARLGEGLLSAGLCRLLAALFNLVVTKIIKTHLPQLVIPSVKPNLLLLKK